MFVKRPHRQTATWSSSLWVLWFENGHIVKIASSQGYFADTPDFNGTPSNETVLRVTTMRGLNDNDPAESRHLPQFSEFASNRPSRQP